jgi:uracil-DNA glycosylase family 4
MTPFQLHMEKYGNGCGSEFCKDANVCLARGSIPADILMIGEAPGVNESDQGIPFVGPAGHLLDHILERAYSHLKHSPRICITNIVGCIPLDEDGRKISAPDTNQIKSCRPRLQELAIVADNMPINAIKGESFITKPTLKAVVSIGDEARNAIDPKFHTSCSIKFHREIPQYHIIHPAALLRKGIAFRDLEVQRCVVTLVNLWIDITKEGEKLSV